AAGHIPLTKVTVKTNRIEAGAVGAEDHPRDRRSLVALDRLGFLLCGHVPELDHRIGAGTRQPFAVRTERDTVDRVAVCAEVLDFLAISGVPQTNGLVGAARREQLAVG